jgi:hypothetical protein
MLFSETRDSDDGNYTHRGVEGRIELCIASI